MAQQTEGERGAFTPSGQGLMGSLEPASIPDEFRGLKKVSGRGRFQVLTAGSHKFFYFDIYLVESLGIIYLSGDSPF